MVRTRSIAAAAVALLALAGCGSSVTASDQAGAGGDNSAGAVYTALNGLPGDQQRAEALKRATAEGGTLGLYTSMTADVADAVVKAFTAQTGVKVTVFRGNSETVLQRVLQESSARRLGADVVETNFLEMQTLAEQQALSEFTGVSRAGMQLTAKFDRWTATRFNLMLPAWNTKLIPAGQEPRTWEDLADPRFRGKITLEVSDSDWYENLTAYWLGHGKTQDEVDTLWRAIVGNSKVAKGHTTMMELLGAGQTPMDAMNYSYITERAKQKGAPVSYRSADGIAHVLAFPRPNGVGMLSAAKHPAAAWLFYDWMLTDGQKVLVDQHLTPASKVPGDHSLDGITLVGYDVKGLTTDGQQTWDKRYDALLRGAPQQK
jgi:iron(III) transport system substrate-binding protein